MSGTGTGRQLPMLLNLEWSKLPSAISNANAVQGNRKFQEPFTRGSLHAKSLEANTVFQDSCRPFQADLNAQDYSFMLIY